MGPLTGALKELVYEPFLGAFGYSIKSNLKAVNFMDNQAPKSLSWGFVFRVYCLGFWFRV